MRFPPAARVPEIDPSAGGAHWGFVLALIIAVAVWFMLSRTMKGFEVRVLGGSPRAGRFAGFSASRMVFFAFLLSGALAGLAGIIEVAGPDRPAARSRVARLRVHGDHRRLPRDASIRSALSPPD